VDRLEAHQARAARVDPPSLGRARQARAARALDQDQEMATGMTPLMITLEDLTASLERAPVTASPEKDRLARAARDPDQEMATGMTPPMITLVLVPATLERAPVTEAPEATTATMATREGI
jgi:hypothetical protein